jgi:hydroxyacylglutathione hydrolase
MKVETIKVGMLQTNCYVVYSRAGGPALVIDPGAEAKKIISFIEEKNLKVENILITHGHFDHILAAGQLKEATGARIVVHAYEADALRKSKPSMYVSIAEEPYRPCEPDVLLYGGEKTKFEGDDVTFICTPGHTPGSLCIILNDMIFSGDTLFKGDCGRTDLAGGSPEEMEGSLRMLYNLKGDYKVYPGHDDPTTLQDERENNPYMQMSVFK